MDLTEISTAVILAATLCSLVVRLSPRTSPTSPPVILCHVGAILILALSQSWIFGPVDRALGGNNLANLLSHICMVFVLWVLTTMIAAPLLEDREQPRVLGAAVLVVGLAGTVLSFLALSPTGSSRGLDAYDHEIPYIAYQLFSLLPLWVPAMWMVPRLLTALRSPSFRRLKATYLAFLVAYSASVPCALSYAAAAFAEWVIPLREILVAITGAGGMIGFFLVTLTATTPRNGGAAGASRL